MGNHKRMDVPASVPDARGYFGEYGGRFVPETLVPALDELTEAFESDRAGQWLAVAYEQLRTLDADFPGPVMGPYKEFRSGVQAAMERVAEAGADPRSAIEEFDEQFQAALDAYRREVGG